MEDDKKQGNKDDTERGGVLKLPLGAAEGGEAAAQDQLLCECAAKK